MGGVIGTCCGCRGSGTSSAPSRWNLLQLLILGAALAATATAPTGAAAGAAAVEAAEAAAEASTAAAEATVGKPKWSCMHIIL